MLALGVRFDDRVTGKLEAFATHARIVHIDIDPAEIHKNKHAHIPVSGRGRACMRESCIGVYLVRQSMLIFRFCCSGGLRTECRDTLVVEEVDTSCC